MNTRLLLLICLALIVCSIFVIPESVRWGIDRGIATELSTITLMAGMGSAMLTVDSDTREKERDGQSRSRDKMR